MIVSKISYLSNNLHKKEEIEAEISISKPNLFPYNTLTLPSD